MVAISVKNFGGMIPAVESHLLPMDNADYTNNCYLYSGSLKGFPATKILHTFVDPNAATAFRLPASYANADDMYGAFWFEFENPDTDLVRAPVFGEIYDRYYWASSSDVPRYDTRARIESGAAHWMLGIPTPAAVSVVASAPSGAAQTRTYGITRVSAYGEEGAMSTTLATLGTVSGTWTLTIPAVGATDDGSVGDDRNITHTNIYRTVVGSSGVATYFFVAQIAGSAVTYVDTVLDNVVSANAILESDGTGIGNAWTPPPSDLKGFIMMGNGVVAAWRNNEVWFSEPYRPHAWPVNYAQTVEFPIMGLGVVNQTLVVCTSGYPVTMTGSHPSLMNNAKLNAFEPCTSRGSVLSTPEGVYYASSNGLVLVNIGQAQNITRDMITRDKWKQITKDTHLRAVRFGTAYYAYGSVSAGVFEDTAFDVSVSTGSFTNFDQSGAINGILIDVQNQRVAFNILTSAYPLLDVISDAFSGELLLARNGAVEWLDQSDAASILQPYIWKSRIFKSPVRDNIGALRVYFQAQDAVSQPNYGLIKLFANGIQVDSRALASSGDLMRLPSGFKATFWQFQVEAQVEIFSINLASTVKELRQVDYSNLYKKEALV